MCNVHARIYVWYHDSYIYITAVGFLRYLSEELIEKNKIKEKKLHQLSLCVHCARAGRLKSASGAYLFFTDNMHEKGGFSGYPYTTHVLDFIFIIYLLFRELLLMLINK